MWKAKEFFSDITITQTKNRNLLIVKRLNILLMLSKNGGESEDFDNIKAFNYWKSAKTRNFL